MNSNTIQVGVTTGDEQAQVNDPLTHLPEQVLALIEEARTLADDVVGLTYQKDLLNSELAFKQKQLRQLCTAMKPEYASFTNNRMLAMEDATWN